MKNSAYNPVHPYKRVLEGLSATRIKYVETNTEYFYIFNFLHAIATGKNRVFVSDVMLIQMEFPVN